MSTHSKDDIKNAVKKHYGEAITKGGACCSPNRTDPDNPGRFAEIAGYSITDYQELPEGVTSFGCGNPVSFMEVKPGQSVLDLGSGAGMDLILAAKKVGPEGKVIGLDMTDEMIEACRRNLEKAGIKNGEVRKGEMEAMPLADGEVDWIISNCVINLSPDKEKVFAEAFRVLKPGGRMLVSDIVTLDLPDEYRADIRAWVGCIAGAVNEADYMQLATDAGFTDVKIIDKMVYDGKSLDALVTDNCGCGPGSVDSDTMVDRFAGKVASVKLAATKPS